jgi:hypothetical protein
MPIDRLSVLGSGTLDSQTPTDTSKEKEVKGLCKWTPAAPSRKQEEEALIKKYAAHICDGAKGPTTVAQILSRFLSAAARVEPTTKWKTRPDSRWVYDSNYEIIGGAKSPGHAQTIVAAHNASCAPTTKDLGGATPTPTLL